MGQRQLPAILRDCADERRAPRQPGLIAEALRRQLRETFPAVPVVDDAFAHSMRERLDRIQRACAPRRR